MFNYVIGDIASTTFFYFYRKCKFSGENELTFAVRIGSRVMTEKFLELKQEQKKIFDETAPDGTSISAFQISYQHERIHDIMKPRVSDQRAFAGNQSADYKEWYTKINRTASVYSPGQKQSALDKDDTEIFLKQSLLFDDEILGEPSNKLFESLLDDMTEFSSMFEQSSEFSFLAFTPRKGGSMRERTKTFAPNEFDLSLALKYTTGLKIIDQQKSQSAVQVDKTADKGWKDLCIEKSDILCPKKLKSKFIEAMMVCCGIAASERDPPGHTEEQIDRTVSKKNFPEYTEDQTEKVPRFHFFYSKYSVERKDKIPCLHLLYRKSPFKDLLISVDFVIGLIHPDYKLEHELPLPDGKAEKCEFYLIPKVSDRKQLNACNAQFLVSYSNVEYLFIETLPNDIRKGFIFAKAARNASLCSLPEELGKHVLEPLNVENFVTTYMLKTCLMFSMTHYSLRMILEQATTSYECAYVLYVVLCYFVQKKGRLPFYFDRSINLFSCTHKFYLDYDDKLGCCLKRALIVGFSECIMESLDKVVQNADRMRAKVENDCRYLISYDDTDESSEEWTDDESTEEDSDIGDYN